MILRGYELRMNDLFHFFSTSGREDIASMLLTDKRNLNAYSPLKVS